jgi:hypothetical protein
MGKLGLFKVLIVNKAFGHPDVHTKDVVIGSKIQA